MGKILQSFIVKDDLNEPLILQGDRVYYTPFKDFKGDFKELNNKFLAIELNGEKSVRYIYHYADMPRWSKELGGVPFTYQLEIINRKYQDYERYTYEQAITEEILQKSGVILGVVSDIERNMREFDYQDFDNSYNQILDNHYSLHPFKRRKNEKKKA